MHNPNISDAYVPQPNHTMYGRVLEKIEEYPSSKNTREYLSSEEITNVAQYYSPSPNEKPHLVIELDNSKVVGFRYSQHFPQTKCILTIRGMKNLIIPGLWFEQLSSGGIPSNKTILTV